MPIIVESDGVEIEFPDDFTEDQISEALTGFQPRNSEVQSSQEAGNQPTVSQPYIPDFAQSSEELERRNLIAQDLIQQKFPEYKVQGQQTGEFEGIPFNELLPKGGIGVRDIMKNRMPIGIGLPAYPQPSEEQIKRAEANPIMQMQAGAAQGVGELAGGIGQYITSEHGAREVIASKTPMAPVVLFKWAKDMVEGGMVSSAEAIEAYKRKDWKELARLVTSAVGMLGGGIHATKSGVKRARPAVEGGIQALQEMTPAGKLSKVERLEAEAWLQQHTQLNDAIRTLESDPALKADPRKQLQLEKLKSQQAEIGLSKAHQKILDDQMVDVDVPVEVVWGSPKSRRGQFMGINRVTGKIEVYGEEFPQWLESVAKKKRAGATRAGLREEQLHLSTPEASAIKYWKSLSRLEQKLIEKIYGAKAGEGGFKESDLGYEALRHRLNRAAGETPREFAEASMEEGLDMKALELMGNAVRGIRENLLKTKSSKRGLEAVERVQGNVEAAKKAYLEENPDPDWSIEGGEAEAGPAAIIRNPKEWEGHVRSYRDVPIDQFGAKLKQSPSGLLTPEAWRIGLAASKPEHIRELQQARQESSRLGKEAREKGDLDTAMIHYTRGQFFREAYEAATGTGSAGEALRETPGYKPPFPDEGGPAAIKKPKPEDLLKRKPGEAKPEEVMALDDAEAIKFFKGNQDRGNSTQNDAVLAGMKLGPGVIEELTQLRDATHKSGLEKLQAGMESGDAQAGMADFGKVIWLNGVIEGAGRKGPNYEGVKARMEQEGPAAVSKLSYEKWKSLNDKIVARILEIERSEPTPQSKKEHESLMDEGMRLFKEYPEYDEIASKSYQSGEGEGGPAAMSKKAQAAAQDRAKLMALRQAAEEGREAPKMEAPVSQPEYPKVEASERFLPAEHAMPGMSGADLENAATKQLSGEIKTRPIKRERTGTGPPRVSYDRPSFDKFSKWAAQNMEGVKPNQLQKLWEDKVWSELLRASPERLEEWRKALGLESSYGRGPIAEPPPEETTFRLEQEFHEGKRYAAKVLKEERGIAGSRNRYRNKLVEAIGLKLVGESFKERPDLSRETITIDDVDFGNTKTQAGPYRELSRDEISDPQVLNRILRDQARASSADPESASRRLVAVVDNQGRVELLSTYNDAGVQRVTDPTGPRTKGRPHRELNQTFLRQYRPIATILLENPVQAFHQRFGSVSEFMDRIGKEAIDRSRVGEFPGEGAVEYFEAEGTAGLEGEGGLVMGPTARGVRAEMGIGRGALESTSPMTDREAGSILEHVLDEVGDFTGAADVRESLAGLTDRAARKRLKPTDWIALSGFNKAFKALEERNPDLGREDILDRMADQIYESYATSDPNKPETFVAKALAAFTPEGGQAVRPVPERQAAPTQGGPRLTPGPMPRPIPGAGGPPLRGITAQAAQIRQARRGRAETPSRKPEMLTREEAAYVRKRPWSPANPEIRTEGRFEGEGPAAFFKRKKLGPTVTDAIRNTGSVYDEWMVDRIGRVGGDMSKQFSDQARAMIDRKKQLYGSMTPSLDPARVAAGSQRTFDVPIVSKFIGKLNLPTPQRLSAMMWLNKRQDVTPYTGTRRVVDAIEGAKTWDPIKKTWAYRVEYPEGKSGPKPKKKFRTVHTPISAPAHVQEVVDLAIKSNTEIGKMYEPVAPGFKAGNKFARNLTATGYDIIRQGRGTAWERWTEGVAKANKMELAQVREFYRDWKAELDKPGADVESIDKVNQDFVRKYPNVITDVKFGGMWHPVIHADLFNYLENTAQRAAHIRAFREVYPNTKEGKKAFNDNMEAIRVELGPEHIKDLDALARTLQGHPTDSYADWGAFSPVRGAGAAFKFFNQTVGNLMAKGVLTGQMFVQPGESLIGATPVFFGYKNAARGLARAKQIYAEMEQRGEVNRVMYDWTFDPNSKVRSTFRIAGNVLSKVFMEQFLNEMQEAHAAATAHVVAERIKAGTLSDWENRNLPQTFKAMGFDRQEVAAMMLGDEVLLDQFKRRAAAFLSSGNKAVAESSRWGANRFLNSVFRFQTYPMMKAQQFRRVMANMSEAWDTGTRQEKQQAAEQLTRFLFGTAAQGVLTTAIVTLAYQGKQGLQIRKEEALDDPLIFAGEAFISSMGGPLYLVFRGARAGGLDGFGEQAARMVFPYSVIREMTDMAQGAGQYRDQSWFERSGRFIKQRLPGTKAIRTGLALAGLSMENKELDASISAFYRWKMSQFDERGSFEPEPSEFRAWMRRAVEALKRGDVEGFNEAYLAAHGASKEGTDEKKQQAIARSFAQRKILKGPGNRQLTPEEKEALQKHIGFEAYDRLTYFDKMLEEAADGVVLPRKD